MNNPLPDNILAALLFTAGADFNMQKAAGFIASGQWPVDAGYEFEGKNLIELAGSNPHITRRPTAAIELIRALAGAGCAARENSWRLAPPEYTSAHARLFLRAMAQGADEERLAYACKALALIKPIKPVKDQAEKIVALIKKAGGFHTQLQGLDLISWMALHDVNQIAGGCAGTGGNDDENTTRRRIRNRVFAHKDVKRDTMTPLSGMLLDYHVAELETRPDKTRGFYISKAGDVMEALEGINDVDAALQPLVGVRAYGMLYDMCTTPGRYSFQINTFDERIDELKGSFAKVISVAAISGDFCPDLAWLMVERPRTMGVFFPDVISMEKAGHSLVYKSQSFHVDDKDEVIAAGNAFYRCLREFPVSERERIAAGMEAMLVGAALEHVDARREVQVFLLQAIEAMRMEARTDAPALTAARPAPRI